MEKNVDVWHTTAQFERDLLIEAPKQVFGLAIAYAATLGWMERKFPRIKPDHIWAEVAGGVLLSLIPVALAARRYAAVAEAEQGWQIYEGAVWRAFMASGTPIILWQLGEAVLRHSELLHYTVQVHGRGFDYDADHSAALATRSGARAGTDAGDIAAGDAFSPTVADED